jgi:hypothetical protein
MRSILGFVVFAMVAGCLGDRPNLVVAERGEPFAFDVVAFPVSGWGGWAAHPRNPSSAQELAAQTEAGARPSIPGCAPSSPRCSSSP